MSLVMMMELQVDPERLAQAAEHYAGMFADTAAFEGCESVEVLEDAADPSRLAVIIRWESAQAQARYREWRATPEGRSGLTDWLTADPVRRDYRPHPTI